MCLVRIVMQPLPVSMSRHKVTEIFADSADVGRGCNLRQEFKLPTLDTTHAVELLIRLALAASTAELD